MRRGLQQIIQRSVARIERAGTAPQTLARINKISGLRRISSLLSLAETRHVSNFQRNPFAYAEAAPLLGLPGWLSHTLFGREVRPDRMLPALTPTPLPHDLQTSLTLEYQAREWGVMRAALDGYANHLPSDSGGTRATILFHLKDGSSADFSHRGEVNPEKVTAISFQDDGRGYDATLLGLLWSSKLTDEGSIGEKGEGLKMAIMAAMRSGMGMHLTSTYQDTAGVTVSWEARPYVREKKTNMGQSFNQLHFDITRIQRSMENHPTGSTTRFQNPSPGFTRFVLLELEKKVRSLRKDQPFAQVGVGDILDDSGDVFIKGVFITDAYRENLSFGYDLRVVSPNRDRDNVAPDKLKYGLRRLYDDLTDREVIRRLIKKSAGADLFEYEILSWNYVRTQNPDTGQWEIDRKDEPIKQKELWRDVFYELYGDPRQGKYVLEASNPSMNELARLHGYRIISLPSYRLNLFFEKLGIPSAETLELGPSHALMRDEPSYLYGARIERMPTSWTKQSGRIPWGEKRIILDALSNHFDAQGGVPFLEFLIASRQAKANGDPSWISVSERREGDVIHALRIRDEGRGFDAEMLDLLFSDKGKGENATGGFGEGLGQIGLAAIGLRDTGMEIKFRSDGWAAVPIGEKVTGKFFETERLSFAVARGLPETIGSATTIYKPTPAIMSVVDHLPSYVLSFNHSYAPLHEVNGHALFDPRGYPVSDRIDSHAIFVRGMHITDNHKDRTLFSYNLDLGVEDLSPDRNEVRESSVRKVVAELLNTTSSTDILQRVIAAASKNGEERYEFVDVKFDDVAGERARAWQTAFATVHGEKAVLYTGNDGIAISARHSGYNPISLHENIRRTLYNAGVMTDRDVLSEGLIPVLVPRGELLPHELEMLGVRTAIDNAIYALRHDFPAPPRFAIYSDVRTKWGDAKEDTVGFYKRIDDTIYLRRDLLSDRKEFVKTYTHERGHQITGASDPDDAFREFFEELAWRFVEGEISSPDPLSERIADLKSSDLYLRSALDRMSTLEDRIAALAQYAARFVHSGERPALEGMTAEEQADFALKVLEGHFLWRISK